MYQQTIREEKPEDRLVGDAKRHAAELVYRELPSGYKLVLKSRYTQTPTRLDQEQFEDLKQLTLDKQPNTAEVVGGRLIMCYDKPANLYERYTVICLDEPYSQGNRLYLAHVLSDRSTPSYMPPQKDYYHPSPHLGSRITFSRLPKEWQVFITDELNSMGPSDESQ